MSLRQVFGAVVGGIIGFFTGGGIIGGIRGAIAGYTIATAFEDTEVPPGPRLDNLDASFSTFGRYIPRTYGRDSLSGNIIWMQENKLQERVRRVKVADGGLFGGDQYQDQAEYFASFAVAICEGPAVVKEIYANDELIWADAAGGSANTFTNLKLFNWFGTPVYLNIGPDGEVLDVFTPDTENNRRAPIRIYAGNLEQEADPLIVEQEGPLAPAFRGVCSVVFEQLALTNEKYRNQIPRFRFVIERNGDLLEVNQTEVLPYLDSATLSTADGNQRQKASVALFRSKTSQFPPPLLNLIGWDGDSRNGQNLFTNYIRRYWVDQEGFHGNLRDLRGACVHCHYLNRNYVYVSYCRPQIGDAPYRESGQTIVTLKSWGNEILWSIPQTNPTKVTQLHFAFPVITERYLVNEFITDEFDPTGIKLPYVDGDVAWLYPWDFHEAPLSFAQGLFDTGAFSHMQPVTNSKDLYIIVWKTEESNLSTKISVAKKVGSRFAVTHLRGLDVTRYRDLVTEDAPDLPPGGSNELNMFGPAWWLAGLFPGGAPEDPIARNIHDIQAVLLDGNIYMILSGSYIKSKPLPGLFKIPLSGLSNTVVPFEKVDKITTYLGGARYRNDGENYEANVGGQETSEWQWFVEYDYDILFVDYERGALYGSSYGRSSNAYTGELSHLNNQADTHLVKIDTSNGAVEIDYGQPPGKTLGVGYPAFLNTGNVPAGGDDIWQVLEQHSIRCIGRVVNGKELITPTASYEFDEANGITNFCWLAYEPNQVLDGSVSGPDVARPSGGYQNNMGILPLNNSLESSSSFVFNHVGFTVFNEIPNPLPDGVGDYTITGSIYTEFFTNRIDVITSDTQVSVGKVLQTEVLRAGLLDEADIDFTELQNKLINGYSILDRSNLSSTFEVLQDAYLADIFEEDGKIKGRFREDAVVTRFIPFSDLRASAESDQNPELKLTIPTNYKLPSNMTATFRDPEQDYQSNSVYLHNPEVSNNIVANKIYPLVLTTDEAIKILDQVSRVTNSASKGIAEVWLTYKHSDLEVGNFIDVGLEDGSNLIIRITDIDKGRPGIVQVVGQIDKLSNYASNLSATRETNANKGTTGEDFNPVLIDSLGFEPKQGGIGPWIGSYNAVSNSARPVSVYVSYDDGNSFNYVTKLSNRSSVGVVTGLPDNFEDRLIGVPDSRFQFKFTPTSGLFQSVDLATLLQDEVTNTFFFGDDGRWELIKIKDFTDNGDGTFLAGGLISGYKGTQHNMNNHEIGDKLIRIDRSLFKFVVPFSQLYNPMLMRFTANFSETALIPYANQGLERFPLAPINLDGFKSDNGDWNLSWVRQARYNVEWVNNQDVELDELVEEYRLYILDPSDDDRVVREIVSPTPSAVYLEAEQITDWGASQATVTWAVAQYSPEIGIAGYTSIVTL